MKWWACTRSLQRLDDLLDGCKDLEARFLRLHVRFCPGCKPWYEYERRLLQALRANGSPAFGGAASVMEAVRSAAR